MFSPIRVYLCFLSVFGSFEFHAIFARFAHRDSCLMMRAPPFADWCNVPNKWALSRASRFVSILSYIAQHYPACFEYLSSAPYLCKSSGKVVLTRLPHPAVSFYSMLWNISCLDPVPLETWWWWVRLWTPHVNSTTLYSWLSRLLGYQCWCLIVDGFLDLNAVKIIKTVMTWRAVLVSMGRDWKIVNFSGVIYKFYWCAATT